MAKKKKAETEPALNFEEAIELLQQIVSDLETGSFGLEESLNQYEKGTGLLKHCYTVLETAEQKIEQLTGFNDAGEAECEPFDSSATHDQKKQKAGRRKQSAAPKTTESSDDNPPAERNLF